MTRKTLLKNIRKLRVSDRVKEELARLSVRSKKLVENILLFLRRHRQLAESLLLGAIVAFLLTQIPVLGHFLGLCALVTSGAIGLMREMNEALKSTFGLSPA
jgi:uncharacterized protein involved in cysteine biosynthesis